MKNDIQKQQYAQFNQHIIVADPYLYEENEELLTGFAIRKEDLGSFMVDLEALVKRYGGVGFDELLENDWGAIRRRLLRIERSRQRRRPAETLQGL